MSASPSRTRRQLQLLVRRSHAKPAYAAGLRCAIATAVPLVAASAFHLDGASWMSLAGFSVALADKGGSYRTRARTAVALALLGAVAAVLGGIAGAHGWSAILAIALWAGAGTLARVLGGGAISVAISSTVILIISLAAPAPSLGGALDRAWGVLVGAAWAALLSLVLWPLRPYRPIRRATAEVYRLLARHLTEVAALLEPGAVRADATALDEEYRRFRQRLEDARALVAGSRRGRAAESERGERLLVLVELADQLFGLSVAATELASAEPDEQPPGEKSPGEGARLRPAVGPGRAAFDETAAAARAIASAVLREGAPAAETIELARRLSGLADAELGRADASVIDVRLLEVAAAAVETTASLEGGLPPIAAARMAPPAPPAPSWSVQLRAAATPGSFTLQHALRVAITIAVAMALTYVLPLGHGYWLTLTVLIVLQPQTGATVLKTVQRVVGTVIGAALTAVAASVVTSPTAIIALIVVLIAVCVSLLPVNYLLYSAFLTPPFVLLAELSAGDWHLAGLRVENTLIGGTLALAGALLLWPSRDRSRFGELMAATLDACAAHLREIATRWTDLDGAAAQAIAARRRSAAMAAANADAGLESLLGSSAESGRVFEARMTLVTYARRVLISAVALATTRLIPGAGAMRPIVARFAEHAAAGLDEIGRAVAERRAPAMPVPSRGLDAIATDAASVPAVARQLERVARQVTILHDAAARLAPAAAADAPLVSAGATAQS
jgi:uncharacterized membrane protein YccC